MYEFGDMVSHVETQEMRDRASIPSKLWKLEKDDDYQKSSMMKLNWLLDLPLGQKMGFSLAN
jgi:hypothetical protein